MYLENVEEKLLFIDHVEMVLPSFPIPFGVFHGGRAAQRIGVGIEFVENGREEHNLEFGKLNCVVIRDDDREAMDGCVNVMFKQQR